MNNETRRLISSICCSMAFSFLSILETCMSIIDLFRTRSLWGNLSFDFASCGVLGFLGGIISIWYPWVFSKKRIVSNENILIIEGVWSFSKFTWFMVNVYAPQDENRKKSLWEYLNQFMARNKGVYFIFGDFNTARCEFERCVSVFSQRVVDDYNNFIWENDLIDVPMGG